MSFYDSDYRKKLHYSDESALTIDEYNGGALDDFAKPLALEKWWPFSTLDQEAKLKKASIQGYPHHLR